MKTTAIIVDDEKMARALLEGMLREYCPEVEILDSCIDLPSGVKSIRKNKPDLVFLDIEMPGHSGIELLDFFDEKEVNFSIIFTTAYNQYAINAFKLSAIDYLLKPIEPEELESAVNRFKNRKQNFTVLKENLNSDLPKKIAVSTVNSIKFIETNDILFLKAEGSYTDITLSSGKVLTASKGLKKFEEVLDSDKSFYRCHKSYIVNLKYISEYIKTAGGSLLVNDEFHVGLSSEKVSELFELMDWER
jgi:two-component system LytT family response regulator